MTSMLTVLDLMSLFPGLLLEIILTIYNLYYQCQVWYYLISFVGADALRHRSMSPGFMGPYWFSLNILVTFVPTVALSKNVLLVSLVSVILWLSTCLSVSGHWLGLSTDREPVICYRPQYAVCSFIFWVIEPMLPRIWTILFMGRLFQFLLIIWDFNGFFFSCCDCSVAEDNPIQGSKVYSMISFPHNKWFLIMGVMSSFVNYYVGTLIHGMVYRELNDLYQQFSMS